MALSSETLYLPQKTYPDIDSVQNDDVNQNDMSTFMTAVLDHTGLVSHNLESYNNLIGENGIPFITTDVFGPDSIMVDNREQTEVDRSRESVRIQFKFCDAQVGKPVHSVYPSGRIEPLFPNKSRISGNTYKAPIHMGGIVTLTAKYKDGRQVAKVVTIPKFKATEFPIMVKSKKCHTTYCTREALKSLEEDPNDVGGYFIIGNQEYVIDLLENVKFNTIHIHNKMAPNELVRGEFFSQRGSAFETSSQLIVRHMVNGSLSIEVNSTKLHEAKLPFYLIYRLFGMSSDRDIVNTIILDPECDDAINEYIKQSLEKAILFKDDKDRLYQFRDIMDAATLIQQTAEPLTRFLSNRQNYKTNENAIRYLISNMLNYLDVSVLPHLGIDASARISKLRFLGMIIRKLYLVELRISAPMDRDSFANKRVHGAGISLAKSYKTRFNKCIVTPILRSLKKMIKNNPFEEITDANVTDVFRTLLISSDLDREIEQSITAGNKVVTVQKQTMKNRVSSQIVERKNYLTFITTLRTITAHMSKNASTQTERADMLRRVHPSYPGFVCISRSVDTGDKVGMHKELALSATVCEAVDVMPFKTFLLKDPEFIPLERIRSEDILRKKYALIFVNGQWLGATHNSPLFIERYRLLRREGKIINKKTTISWDPVVDEIAFTLDAGRLIRPLIIVDNNLEKYDDACRKAFEAKKAGDKDWEKYKIQFTQNIRLTSQIFKKLRAGAVTADDLVNQGFVEYITPEESQNCLLANSIETLFKNKHNVCMRFTHCDIEEGIFGLSSLVSPYGNHTQPVRITCETNQARQTCGWFSFAAPFRNDKNKLFQFYNEMPLVKTIAQKYTYPNGMNCVVAYMSYYGYGQEDSIIFNQATVDRDAYAGSFYRFEKVLLEKNEQFCNPDITTTKNLKPNASYEKLVDGFVTVGTVINQGDILIGRVVKIRKDDSKTGPSYQYADKSVEYTQKEPVIVDRVWKPRGAGDEQLGIVKYRAFRKLETGDKLSSRSGNKGIIASIMPASDMPFLEDGTRPDVIINMASIPSRMLVGQPIETSVGKVCAERGFVTDGTPFRKVSHPTIMDRLTENGFRFNGKEIMHNGVSGDYMDAAIFIGPTFHQRLQKFIRDDTYCTGPSGPTDSITFCPREGKNRLGSGRLGEMELWTLEAHGSGMNMFEKISHDSNGCKLPICRTCGNIAIYNEKFRIHRCQFCGDSADINLVESSRGSSVMMQSVQTSNIKMRFGLEPRQFESYEGPE